MPKTLLETVREDDFVEYYLFPVLNTCDDKEQEIILNSLLNKANKVINKHSSNYLWHKDEFKLVPRTTLSNYLSHIDGKTENLPPHLYGVTHYGDNIEDEWFIVFILQQLTKELTGTIARVYDADGEFLMIEAADFLPKWAEPDTCQNRVYIYDGNIHLIPLTDPENPHISVPTALSILRENPTETLAPQGVQNMIKNKLNSYPDKIKDNLHHCTVYVPVAIAAILKVKPNLIAPAVLAFCNRDTIDTKVMRAMKYFAPENRVKTRVTFTKCLYAMLTYSKYMPDRRTGWNLPPVNSPEYKSHILGIKLACGFEILASQAKPSADIEGDKAWDKYLNSLKEKNYFKGLLEHSREYNNLLNKAKEYYINHRDTMHYTPAIGQEIVDMLQTLELNPEDLKKDEAVLLPDDDDSWLNISPEELDKMLQERYGQKKILKVNNNTDASDFADKITTFLNHVSDVEGAEFPPDQQPLKPPRSKNKKSNSRVSFAQDVPSNNKNSINFDANSFSCAVQNILNFVIPEDDSWDLDSDSDMSEYEEDNCVKKEPYDEVKNKMDEYMDAMDAELARTTIGESFEKTKNDNFEDIESFQPVDIDVNALKNILESYRSQMGEAGPSSNMLGQLGMDLDRDD